MENQEESKSFKSMEELKEVFSAVKKTTPMLLGGLTKREYFAGLAMQGILSNSVLLADMQKDYGTDVDNQIAHNAIETADALLKALEMKTE